MFLCGSTLFFFYLCSLVIFESDIRSARLNEEDREGKRVMDTTALDRRANTTAS